MVKRFIRVISNALHSNEKSKREDEERSQDSKVEVMKPEDSHIDVPRSRTQITIDGSTGEIVQEDLSLVETADSSLTIRQEEVAKNLPGHPEDVIRLAAINEAFYKGILALQNLNLDEDLYWQAIEDLRRKYYQVRSSNLATNNRPTKTN